jgi:2-dehydro-3-deoxygluconokinase
LVPHRRIFAALSATTGDVVIEAARIAKKHGTVVSYDLNNRASLWAAYGGLERCRKVNRAIAPSLDVVLGNEEDFTACLGLEVEGVEASLLDLEVSGFKSMIGTAVATYPNLKAVAATLRAVKTATINDWGAICWCDGGSHRHPAAGSGDPRPRGRWRQLRLRLHLWPHGAR